MKGNGDPSNHQVKSKVIKLQPKIERTDEHSIISSMANMLGEIDEKIKEHYDGKSKEITPLRKSDEIHCVMKKDQI